MKFLGRQFDAQRNGWVFSDGSGFVPEEMRIEVIGQFDGRPYAGLRALLKKFEWDARVAECAKAEEKAG